MGFFSATDEEVKDMREMLKRVLEAFVGMLIALGWTTVINKILDSISEAFPFLAIFGAFLYAFLVTVFGLAILFYMNKFINLLTQKMLEKKGNQETKKDSIDHEFE